MEQEEQYRKIFESLCREMDFLFLQIYDAFKINSISYPWMMPNLIRNIFVFCNKELFQKWITNLLSAARKALKYLKSKLA